MQSHLSAGTSEAQGYSLLVPDSETPHSRVVLSLVVCKIRAVDSDVIRTINTLSNLIRTWWNFCISTQLLIF